MPKLLLNTETWSNMTNQNMTTMEKIQSQAIKRLLKIPYTTPTKGLLYELGMLSVENEIIKRRLMFMHRTLSINHETLCKRVMLEQNNMPGRTWLKETREMLILLKIDTTIEELEQTTK